MLESKQSRVRLVVTPVSTLRKSCCKSLQECRDVERINVLDLKALIVKRVGMQRANRYFVHFVHFLSSHMSKIELDKVVIATIGKKNVPLHNQLVRAILSNAVNGKAPPPLLPSPLEKFGSKYQSPSVTSNRPHTSPSTLSNGDSFLSSPRSVRSTAQHNRDRDYRVSPLGHSEAHSSPSLSQLIQQPEVAAKQLDSESNSSLKRPAKRARLECPVSDDSASVIESEVLGGEEILFCKEEREVLSFCGPIRGSIGFPSHFDSENSCKRPKPHAFPAQILRQGEVENHHLHSNDLPDGDVMHSLVEQAALREGLEGASRECAGILNVALDAYLKRLIASCVSECAGKVNTHSSQDHSSWNNGSTLKLGRHSVKGVCNRHTIGLDKLQHVQSLISLENFRVAMDANPQQLGGNWAVQLEKILFRIFGQ